MALQDKITVIDFGGQYTQLIARRVREAKVYSEVVGCDRARAVDLERSRGVILSGGPKSVTGKDAPEYSPDILSTGKPILGICYGFQLMAHHFDGHVEKGDKGEYGKTKVKIVKLSKLFEGLEPEQTVWMSHWDVVRTLPKEFVLTAATENGIAAAMEDGSRNLYGVQFHPEVTHTPRGMDMLRNFVYNIAGCEPSWSLDDYVMQSIDHIGRTVNGRPVIMFVSGGVDSTVAATLLTRAKAAGRNIGDVYIVHIDNGLMRLNESAQVLDYLKRSRGLENLMFEDASSEFLAKLKDVVDPEQKRKIIGDTFVSVMERIVQRLNLPEDTMLCQGTLYTDLIESGRGVGDKAAVIKSHHNVNSPFINNKRDLGLLVEPNREIFKDEVRKVGEILGLPEEIVYRHPFPGPGLAIRIVGGDVTTERLDLLRRADDIYLQEIRNAGLYKDIWQAFAALLCVKSVGVMGDERTHQYMCALCAVTSEDGMTADSFDLPKEVRSKVMTRIINEVKGINRVLVDETSKPPGTIEFE